MIACRTWTENTPLTSMVPRISLKMVDKGARRSCFHQTAILPPRALHHE
jgi:hypothetical protein